jgi:hypothetical protein
LLRKRRLSAPASDLVQFDSDSILQVVKAEQAHDPDLWVADPDQYENNGRVFRDSESPRMLAYSSDEHVLYATDGCNSCARHVPAKLQSLAADELRSFAAENEIPLELLEYLVSLL